MLLGFIDVSSWIPLLLVASVTSSFLLLVAMQLLLLAMHLLLAAMLLLLVAQVCNPVPLFL